MSGPTFNAAGGANSYNATGGANTWATPRPFAAAALAALGHHHGVELDCAALAHTSLGPRYFGPDHAQPGNRDALRRRWRAAGVRWLNMPYSRQCTVCDGFVWHDVEKDAAGNVVHEGCKALGHPSRTIADWMAKCVIEGRDRRSGPLVTLPPARTDGWWHVHVHAKAARVLLVRGRLRFLETVDGVLVRGENSSPMPSAVVEYLPPPTDEPGHWLTQYGMIANDGSVADVPSPVWVPA